MNRKSPRLTLIPATLELAQAELADRNRFVCLLQANVPEAWPPETLADALPLFVEWLKESPQAVGWFGWYALTTPKEYDTQMTLVASGGFLGPPEAGVVRLGYSVLPEFWGRGYATELALALAEWAEEQPGVQCISAETEWANPASVRVLEKAGFRKVGPNENGLGGCFERRRTEKA